MTVSDLINGRAEALNDSVSRRSRFTNDADARVPRVERLSYRDFVFDFQRKRRPVIITDATQKWSARAWTPESLKQKVGHRQVEIRTQYGTQAW